MYMYVLVPKINADLKIFLTILLYFFLSLTPVVSSISITNGVSNDDNGFLG